MLQARRAALRLAERPLVCQRRGYADPPYSPDPTTSDRKMDVQEPPPGPESSGKDSLHTASAGGHGPIRHGHHPEPVNEHLGRGFFISIAALALSFAVYKYSRSSTSDPDRQPLLTRVMQSYNWFQDEFARRNALHTAMVEQAAEDRNLFQSSPWTHHTELKFQEIFNTGSPYNVPAGHSIDLSAIIAHYEKQNAATEEKRIERVTRQAEDAEVQAQQQATERSRKSSILQQLGLAKPDA